MTRSHGGPAPPPSTRHRHAPRPKTAAGVSTGSRPAVATRPATQGQRVRYPPPRTLRVRTAGITARNRVPPGNAQRPQVQDPARGKAQAARSRAKQSRPRLCVRVEGRAARDVEQEELQMRRQPFSAGGAPVSAKSGSDAPASASGCHGRGDDRGLRDRGGARRERPATTAVLATGARSPDFPTACGSEGHFSLLGS